jgi:16S rRNA C1402 N4-methylase RsmH
VLFRGLNIRHHDQSAMIPPRPTRLAWMIVGEILGEGDLAIDATAGNGHDTAFLAERVGADGRVIAFDIQPEAIHQARAHIRSCGFENRVTLIQDSHTQIQAHATPGAVTAVMFNLGYLPGGDHALATESSQTLIALDQAVEALKSGGLLSVVCYPGHAVGFDEASAVENKFKSLSQDGWRVASYKMTGTLKPAPFLLVAGKP